MLWCHLEVSIFWWHFALTFDLKIDIFEHCTGGIRKAFKLPEAVEYWGFEYLLTFGEDMLD